MPAPSAVVDGFGLVLRVRHDASCSGMAVRDDAGGRAGRRQRRRVARLVAPLSDGPGWSRVDLAERAEPVAQLGGVQLRLLPGGEVPAAVELVVVDEVGI